ncbi:unnamed protein product [Sordaria macrospora k-hell]|uniref:WGS project CABT00000000 data, contig 2.58 n=1 Tax=Sordaria macrospora (strain ATCC MYA-333 / DSM 997 / K(L3346) / K-hell) TaxID=771870 RepID=F7WA78_SORMK|nr:uncharacterized protein SMAC_08482 [Sordaria macrospora k-hell]CCC14141.1 unnamed protein product [Sordaria macrospora k-hell]
MSNPRRRPAGGLTLKTNVLLQKGATFHSPNSPASGDSSERVFVPPSLPRRSHTNLDDVIDSRCRRVALTLDAITRQLASSNDTFVSAKQSGECIPPPRGLLQRNLDSPIMPQEAENERRMLRPRTRRSSRHHDSDSGLGSSIASTSEKDASCKAKTTRTSAVTRSAAARSASALNLPGLSDRATNRIVEYVLKPLLAKPALKEFHSLVLECPKKIQDKEILCLRDLEKTLILVAPVSETVDPLDVRMTTYRALLLKERTKAAGSYLDFCLTTIDCLQATVQHLGDRELTRPRDLPYTNGYFVDLVDQFYNYARQIAESNKTKDGANGMEVDPYDSLFSCNCVACADIYFSTDQIKIHGGPHINGRLSELVRVKKNGQAISLATGLPVDLCEKAPESPVNFKRSQSEEALDEEEVMRSMARRKKNASPEELAPKRCREPGCNKEFKRPCDLTKHEKTHSRPWKCPVKTCKYHEYGWPTEKEMDRHHNDKHSSAPPMYECLFKPCPYKSKRESNCKQHMEKAHGWTYVRTKTNGKKPSTLPSLGPDSGHPTPQLQNIGTPSSDRSMSIATPSDDWNAGLYQTSIEFPSYAPEFNFNTIPQQLELDYSPIDNGTPLTDAGMDHNSAYQDLNEFTLIDDIYGATMQLPNQVISPFYPKDMGQHLGAYTAPELCQSHPAHISPIGQGNTMLFTPPTSLGEIDEGFDDQDFSMGNCNNVPGDFILYPPTTGAYSKPTFTESLFANVDIPSLAAGYSQPSSQDILHAYQGDWTSHDMNGYF